MTDPFADMVRRLPWLEHERLHREKHEGELRNRAIEPEPSWRTEEDGQPEELTVVWTDCGSDDCALAIALLRTGLFDLGDLS